MLLGLSSEENDLTVGLDNVAGSQHGDGGVSHGSLLVKFAEEVHENGEGLAATRRQLIDSIGPAGLVDAAAICANFNMMVRIADGTGTPLDAGTVDASVELRSDLGLDTLVSRRIDA